MICVTSTWHLHTISVTSAWRTDGCDEAILPTRWVAVPAHAVIVLICISIMQCTTFFCAILPPVLGIFMICSTHTTSKRSDASILHVSCSTTTSVVLVLSSTIGMRNVDEGRFASFWSCIVIFLFLPSPITHHPAQLVLLSNMFLLLPAAASSLFFLTSHVTNIVLVVVLVLLILMKLRCRYRRSNVCCWYLLPAAVPQCHTHSSHSSGSNNTSSQYYHSCHDSATTSSASSTNNIELLRRLWEEVILIVPFLLTTKEEKAFFLVGLLFLFAPGSKQSQ